ncbi:MAG: hypothetical protein RLZ92_403 [Pseudomonadota bacterium]|jgi:hypothetical protein
MFDSRTYLNVPFAEKDAAKALGARWDPANKKWYIAADKDPAPFAKWQMQAGVVVNQVKPVTNNPATGVMTYPQQPDFVAYNGELPPWA